MTRCSCIWDCSHAWCGCPEHGDEAQPHWAVVMAGNICVAQGYCWCGSPEAARGHAIGFRPDRPNGRTNA